jgi:hypothetical protein
VPEYVYEVRRGEELLATGRLSDERELTAGDEVEIAGWGGIVRDAVPMPQKREVRLVIQVRRRDTKS